MIWCGMEVNKKKEKEEERLREMGKVWTTCLVGEI